MSEPIQSIANNNYILHNIDAKKLYVQEPLFTANSGDAVYVGWRPDETVLYSGGTDSTATLSENISAFNYLRVELYNNGVDGSVRGIATFPVGRRGSYNFIGGILSNQLHLYGGALTADGTGISAISGYHQWFTPSTGIGTEYTNSKIEKVIGINRKENA